jgi:cobalt-precorrin 5A hydrolase
MHVYYVSHKGEKIAKKIKQEFDCELFTKPFNRSMQEMVSSSFENKNAIVFIMATGIAVRMISPYIQHKSEDPPVIVIDDSGRFVISLLSGHIGNANALTKVIAEKIDAIPVITTASDQMHILSVDMLAMKYNLVLKDFEKAKDFTAALLKGDLICLDGLSIPETQYVSKEQALRIVVTNKSQCLKNNEMALYRKNLIVSIGCRRHTPMDKLYAFVKSEFETSGYSLESICLITSAWIKCDEMGLIALARHLNVPFKTNEKEAIEDVAHLFQGSDFVKKTIGVTSVSEPCGYLQSNYGDQVIPLVKKDGMTLSVWERKND